MFQFKCEMIVKLVVFLKEIEGSKSLAKVAKHAAHAANEKVSIDVEDADFSQELVTQCVSHLGYGRRAFLDLELNASLDICDLFEESLKNNPTIENIAFEAKAMLQAIQGDLARRYFTFVPNEKAKIVRFAEQNWANVLRSFPGVKHDAIEASHCYSLARNPACIFHSMRIAEVGLRILASKMRPKIKLHQHIDYANWGTILNALKRQLEIILNQPRSRSRQARLEFYSRAADKCEYMNNLWRREVSHAREGREYPDIEALQALTYTREFMETLAERWPTEKKYLRG